MLTPYFTWKNPVSLTEKCCGMEIPSTDEFLNGPDDKNDPIYQKIRDLEVIAATHATFVENEKRDGALTGPIKVPHPLGMGDDTWQTHIYMPAKSFFSSPEEYIVVLTHEIEHAKISNQQIEDNGGKPNSPSGNDVNDLRTFIDTEIITQVNAITELNKDPDFKYDKKNAQAWIDDWVRHRNNLERYALKGIDDGLFSNCADIAGKLTGSTRFALVFEAFIIYSELMKIKEKSPNKSTDDILSELEGKYKPQEPSVDPSECHCPETCRCVGNCEEMQGSPPFWDKKPDINDLWDNAKRTSSPLVLDLNGNGISTTSLDNGVYFDHDGNGFAGKSGWLSKGEGILALDRNDNGVIDDGGELFGNNTLLANGKYAANGFEALREFDTNRDGVIDEKDAIYKDLKVWVDNNGDAFSDKDELLTLEEAGVKSINLGYINSNYVDEHGNAHKQQGSFTKSDGTTAVINDVWFSVDYTGTINIDISQIATR